MRVLSAPLGASPSFGIPPVPSQSAEGAGLVSVSTTQNELEALTLKKDETRFVRLQKNVGVSAKLHMIELQGKRLNVVMVTPTYRPGAAWESTHLSAYTDHVRKWYRRLTGEVLRYVWVAEVQDGKRRTDGGARNVIHYHAIFFLRKGITMPKADKQGWWPHGSTNTMRCTNPVAYVMSYAKKQADVSGLPKGARRYGVGGLAIQARASVQDNFGRAPGGGWMNRVTGEWWPSEYGLRLVTSRQIIVVRLHDHGRPVANVAGPYSWISSDG